MLFPSRPQRRLSQRIPEIGCEVLRNFGASLVAMILSRLLAAGGVGDAGPPLVFGVCASALFLLGNVALGLDSSKPLLVPVTILQRAIPSS